MTDLNTLGETVRFTASLTTLERKDLATICAGGAALLLIISMGLYLNHN